MPAPTTVPNLTKVMKSVEYILQRVNHDNNYRSDGLVVIRGADPTKGIEGYDKTEEFKRYNRAVGIMVSSENEDQRVTGGKRAWKHVYPIMCVVMLTDAEREAGKTLDDVVVELYEDLRDALDPDEKIKAAATSLGYEAISCIDHHVTGIKTDEGSDWPYCNFVATAEFLYYRSLRV